MSTGFGFVQCFLSRSLVGSYCEATSRAVERVVGSGSVQVSIGSGALVPPIGTEAHDSVPPSVVVLRARFIARMFGTSTDYGIKERSRHTLPCRSHPWLLMTVTRIRLRQDGVSGPIGGPVFSSSRTDQPSVPCTQKPRPIPMMRIAPCAPDCPTFLPPTVRREERIDAPGRSPANATNRCVPCEV